MFVFQLVEDSNHLLYFNNIYRVVQNQNGEKLIEFGIEQNMNIIGTVSEHLEITRWCDT